MFYSVQATELHTEKMNQFKVDDYLNDIEDYIDIDMDFKAFFDDILSGNMIKVKEDVYTNIFFKAKEELKSSKKLILSILVVVVISGIISNIVNSFGKSQVTEIAFFVSYIIIIILLMSSFMEILNVVVAAISKMSSFLYVTIPILFILLLATGNITTASIFQPMLLGVSTVLTILINKIIIPAILIFTVIIVVSNISEKEQLKKLSQLIKSATIWILILSITIVIGVMSLEGTLSSSIDGITGKSAKAAISTFIPVVGKTLGDAIDTVLGSIVVLKNSVGVLGVIVILLIGIIPLIKSVILMALFYFTSAIIEPIADERIVKIVGYLGDGLKLLIGLLVTIMFIYVISITLVLKISNVSIMFR